MALFPPANLSLTSKTTAQAVLAWGSALQATSYNVYRDQKQIASGITLLTYTDGTVVAGHRYKYSVSGVVAGVETPRSNAIDVNIEPAANLTFEAVFQEQPGEGGYPDVSWRWQ